MASICLLVFRWVIAVPHGCAYPPVATRSFRPTPRRTRPPPPPPAATSNALSARRPPGGGRAPGGRGRRLGPPRGPRPRLPRPVLVQTRPRGGRVAPSWYPRSMPDPSTPDPILTGRVVPSPPGIVAVSLALPNPPPTRQSVRSLLTPVARHLCGANPGGGWHLVDTVSGGPGAWGHVWGSARSLADELLRTPDVVRGQRVLDLGCARGPGGGGSSLPRLWPGAAAVRWHLARPPINPIVFRPIFSIC